MTDTTGPDTFVISLPDGWRDIPTEPDEYLRMVREGIEESSGATAETSIELRRLLLLLRRTAEGAERDGLVFSAIFADELESDSADEPFVLGAFASMVTRKANDLNTERISFEQLQAAVEPPDATLGVDRLEPPRVVELPHGPAIRDIVRRRIAGGVGDGSTDVVEVRYYTLIGEGAGMAVLSFVTPNVELHQEMGQLFESIAATLEFVAA